MFSNPVYLLFTTPKSFGPLYLRLALAAIFFYHGTRKTLGWFGGQGWHSTITTWSDLAGAATPHFIIVTAMVAEVLVSGALFLGFFTRLAGIAVVILTAAAISYAPGEPGYEGVQLPVVLMVIGLALMSLGGGRLSIDRFISSNLLPHVG